MLLLSLLFFLAIFILVLFPAHRKQVLSMIYEIKIDFEGSWHPKEYFQKWRYLNRLHFIQGVVRTQVVTLPDDWTYHSALRICDVSTCDLPSQGRVVPLCTQEQTMKRNQSSENETLFHKYVILSFLKFPRTFW